MPIQLATPITTSAGYATARTLTQRIPLNDSTHVEWELHWSACDAQGNPTGPTMSVILGPADKIAYAQALAGGARLAMNAALQSNQAALAGTSA